MTPSRCIASTCRRAQLDRDVELAGVAAHWLGTLREGSGARQEAFHGLAETIRRFISLVDEEVRMSPVMLPLPDDNGSAVSPMTHKQLLELMGQYALDERKLPEEDTE